MSTLLRFGAEACDALADAHEAGLAHGSLTRDHLRVVDGRVEIDGLRRGPGIADDVAALGAALYEAAAGRNPLAPEPPEAIVSVLLRAMQGGFATAREMAAALRAAADLPDPETARDASAPPTDTRETRTADRQPFGRYMLVERLGQGGMGVVYRAEDPALKREVALKVLHAGDESDAETIKRFRREAQAVAKLDHPGLVPVLDYGEVDGRYFFTMELVDGHDLTGQQPSMRRAAEIVRDAARAVHAAHAHGIVHRDLKPGNLMVTRDGRVRVMDFGLAKLTRVASSLSRTGMAVGTPSFMPPEQAMGERAIDARSDVWSLGATLFALTTGRVPYDGASTPEILVRVITEDPPRARAVRADVPADLDTIVAKAMSKEPERRYASAAAMADDLARFLAGEPIQARPPGTVRRLRHHASRHRSVLAIAATVLAVAGAAAFVAVPRLQRNRRELAMRSEMRPLVDAVREARAYTYVAGPDVEAKFERAREAVARLDEMSRRHDQAEVWSALGTGWALLGELDRAERALLRAHELAPGDGWVTFNLGRLCIERAIEHMLTARPTAEERRRADAMTAKALEWFSRPAAGWAEATDTDRRVARAYRAMAAGDTDEIVRLTDGVAGNAPETEDLWLIRGRIARDAGSVAWYERALAARPHYVWALVLRGNARRDEQTREALADYDHVLRLVRKPGFLANRAGLRQRLRDFEGALADLDEAVRLDPHSAVSWSNRAAVLEDLGRLDEAVAAARRAVDLEPRHAEHRRGLGALLLRRGDLSDALVELDEAIRLDPSLGWSYANRGTLHLKSGRLEEALADLDRAIKLDAKCWEAYGSRAAVHKERGRMREALADVDEAVRIRPDDAALLSNRGVQRGLMGDAPGALADFELAIKLSPTMAEAYHQRGHVYADLRRSDLAIADFTRAIELDPAPAEPWRDRGAELMETGAIERAIDDFSQAMARDPKDALSPHLRAMAKVATGDLPGAIDDFSEALRRNPRHVESLDGRGNTWLLLGDPGRAAADYDAALSIEKSHVTHFMRAQARGLLRDARGEREDLEEALRLAPADWVNRAKARRKLEALRER